MEKRRIEKRTSNPELDSVVISQLKNLLIRPSLTKGQIVRDLGFSGEGALNRASMAISNTSQKLADMAQSTSPESTMTEEQAEAYQMLDIFCHHNYWTKDSFRYPDMTYFASYVATRLGFKPEKDVVLNEVGMEIPDIQTEDAAVVLYWLKTHNGSKAKAKNDKFARSITKITEPLDFAYDADKGELIAIDNSNKKNDTDLKFANFEELIKKSLGKIWQVVKNKAEIDQYLSSLSQSDLRKVVIDFIRSNIQEVNNRFGIKAEEIHDFDLVKGLVRKRYDISLITPKNIDPAQDENPVGRKRHNVKTLLNGSEKSNKFISDVIGRVKATFNKLGKDKVNTLDLVNSLDTLGVSIKATRFDAIVKQLGYKIIEHRVIEIDAFETAMVIILSDLQVGGGIRPKDIKNIRKVLVEMWGSVKIPGQVQPLSATV